MATKGKTGFQQVAPDVYAMVLSFVGPEGGGPNGGFIVAGDKVIVIDSFITMTAARELLSQIKSLTAKEPSFLIYTHSHGDHITGARVFAPPAIAIAQESTREAMIEEGRSGIERMLQMRPELAPDMKGAAVVLPEITYCDHMSLNFGERQIELIHPGAAHTFGDTIVYLPKEKVLFAGDLLFNHICPPMMGSSLGWVRAISQIEQMDIDSIVPGHGFVCTKKEITELKHFIQRLRREVKKCYDQNMPKEKVTAAINLGGFKDWPHQERLQMDVELIYRELEAAK